VALSRLPALLLLLLLLPAAAQAQFAGITESDQPIEIFAEDGIEWDRAQRVYTARGNARATQGDVTVTGQVLRAFYDESASGDIDISRIEASGRVEIVTADADITGDRGFYDLKQEVMKMFGPGVRLVSGDDELTADDYVEYWPESGRATAQGAAQVVRTDRSKGERSMLRAQTLNARFSKDGQALEVVEAEDGVEVVTPCEYVSARRGRYDVARQLAELSGGVKITRGSNQLNGENAEVDLQRGVSRLTGGRVQGLLIPGSGGAVRQGEFASGECE